ncbi:four-helix bundle copper-binding protein [Parapedobacter sp. ISTM3]|uniref:Four-helix bundle copper-binding protein n=1 Tax=Parapedobacter luteus TaxID=623280 RepID=A0A1T5DAM6_9SPHI|nr:MULTISPECIES: four-helix bundle copper-binding protein [Parapedobacter]MBK1438489.1 four-helix bundle copper-binding protein [Parapedobacter sp. ISTM3]SKB68666.1 hypothetical protein SAMN05660226_02656 [Parapedobacter luteus]
MDERYHAVLEKLWHCALSSEKCAAACLASERVGALATCIRLSQDCADTCMLLVRSIKRKSVLVPSLLAVCDFVCKLCAEECDKQEEDYCQQCAAACLLCSEACRQFINDH